MAITSSRPVRWLLMVFLWTVSVTHASDRRVTQSFQCDGVLIHNPTTEAIYPCRFEGTPVPSSDRL